MIIFTLWLPGTEFDSPLPVPCRLFPGLAGAISDLDEGLLEKQGSVFVQNNTPPLLLLLLVLLPPVLDLLRTSRRRQ